MQTIIDIVEISCNKFQNEKALQHKIGKSWEGLTYGALQTEFTATATGLLKSGFKQGDHAAIIGPSSPRWIAAYLGILRAGGIVVPIDKELKSSELRHILQDSDSTVLFTTRTYIEIIQDIIGDLKDLKKIILIDEIDSERSDLNLPGIFEPIIAKWEQVSANNSISEEDKNAFLTLLQSAQSEVKTIQEMTDTFAPFSNNTELSTLYEKGRLSIYRDFLAKDDLQNIELPPYSETPNSTAVILYTSGTTGRSKGAMLSHANITSNINSAIDCFDLRNRKVTSLSFLPINHVFEQVCGIMLPLSLGGTVYFAESLKKLGDNLKELNPTFFLGVPAVYKLLSDRIMKSINSKLLSRTLFSIPIAKNIVTAKIQKTIGKDAILVSGGAALDPVVSKIFSEFGLQLFQGYGITETSPVISAESFTHRKPGTVGVPIEGVSVKIDSPNDDGIGEIWVSGPNIMQGYYKNQKATDEVLEEGWYKTGDLGFIDKEGYITISGRVKNLIVTPNGKNVYPEEIESELQKSPFIAEIMVYGHKIDSASEEVHAVIFPDQEHLDSYAKEKGLPQLDLTDVNEIIKKEILSSGKMLADYKRIKKFTLRDDEFPKTTTRKIKRFAVEADVSANK